MDSMERFWVTWPAGADVAAAYEVRAGRQGVETVLYANGAVTEERAMTGLEEALGNMLAGLTPSGEVPRQPRNLDEAVACVHAQLTSTGTVTVGWGVGTREDRTGGRAEARLLLAHGQADLGRRRGSGRLAG
jgi:hypothetical protein